MPPFVAKILGTDGEPEGEAQEPDWAWAFYILCHEWHLPYSEIGKMNMVQVAHCLRVSGEVARMATGKLSRHDRAILKSKMDQAFTEQGAAGHG